ncbi:DUF2231 domain-containing protein [Nonomuraea helvata]|uniref:DUF2231 domain-containing protein n=1 Tax=Nonomuraea helvata TaxID=37484 RepID=A0ABV5S525_9ACTN
MVSKLSATPRPLHPPLTHAPIGAILIATVLDVISVIDGGAHPWARDLFHTGTYVLMTGMGVMFLAIIAGVIDRRRLTAASSRPRQGADVHAALMTALAVVCVLEITLRRNVYADAHATPAVVTGLSVLALALVTVGGELGGRLVYRAGVGVRGDAIAPAPRS